MRSRWKRIRYRLEWAGLVLATKLIPLCSRKVCYHLAQVAGVLLSFLDRQGYRVALSNLEVAFGDQLSARKRRKIARESFQHFAGTMRLYKALRRKGRTALLVDLTVPPSQGAVAIDCFGLKTSVTSAHAWLNERTGIPIIPAHCEPMPNGRYRLIFHPKISNTDGMTHQQIAQACWNSFEPYVRKNPAPWLWTYKHWRYLPANADRPYPFYANFYRPFEEMLERDKVRRSTEGNEENEGV